MTEFGCEWDAAQFLIFSSNVDPLVYYSHLGPMIAALLLGIFVLLNNRKALVNWALFFVTLMFAAWTYFDLILWASPTPQDVMFFWSAIIPVEMLIYAGSLYLVYLFTNGQKDISLTKKILIAIPFIPLILLLHTSYTVTGLSPDCDEGAIEGPVIQYMYLFEFVYIIWTALLATRGVMLLKNITERKQMLFVGIGVVLLLLVFSLGNITLVFSLDPAWEQYKLFGMPIFVAFIAYSIVKFRTFNAKVMAAQALVVALAIAVLSLLFLQTIPNIRIIAGITFIFVCVLGYLLIRSVKREVQQREHIEVLAKELAETNDRQETLIHFIGHEVKGFLTKDAGVFASLSEGDFGQLSEQMKPFIEEALVESRRGADSVGNILKASNLKKGTVTYTKEPFDFKQLAAEAVEKAKRVAEEKGLALTFTAADGASYQMTGDKAQLNDHVLRNLIDNAVNYTPSGSIAVSLKRDGTKIVFAVKDSGIGITEEDKKRLFTEGGHGEDSQTVNVHSTGYGLYIAKQIAIAHGGAIRAESEGADKGSTFIVEFPVAA